MSPIKHRIIFLLSAALLLSACSAPPPAITATLPLPTSPGALTPFVTRTATATPTPSNPATPTPLPSPTPTPRTHVVKKGEDMGGIAYRYHITVQELMAANPTVNPNIMSVGTSLTIPYSKTPEPPAAAGAAPSSEPPTPTPIPLEIGQINCAVTQEGGAWCFLPVINRQGYAVEGVSAVIRAADKDAHTIVPLAAFPLLDVLPAGASLPVSAYFPPNLLAGLAQPLQFSGELVSSLPSSDDGRYLPAEIKSQKVLISEDGLSAEVQMEAMLSQPAGAAQRVWVAAVAYNARGEIVGARRWENTGGQALQGGTPYPVDLHVYSVGGEIDHVALTIEVRP